MADILSDYFDALDRLESGDALRVPKQTRITNDAVALEAGRGPGAIKKSRPLFSDLIEQIQRAADRQSLPEKEDQQRLKEAKLQANRYKRLYEEALCREVSLLYENEELKKRLTKGK